MSVPMSKISLLSETTINQIAAGEVIENPAAVIKELVENAIDAKATQITVHSYGGGFVGICVEDNGYGMNREDAILCVKRHATSKIQNASDLDQITTMGFRGEALASIAHISRFRIVTCDGTNDHLAVEVRCDVGKIQSVKEAARAQGTTVEVKQLFSNVPVRRKFQKSPAASTTQIVKTITGLCMAYPQCSIELLIDGKSRLQTSGQGLKAAVKEIFGEEFLNQLLWIENKHLKGFIGKPHTTRKGQQYLFINKRVVQVPVIQSAILEGYGTRIDPKDTPPFILHFTCSAEWIDVNVHPQKREVRFCDEGRVKQIVRDEIQQCFTPIQSTIKHESSVPWTSFDAFEELELPTIVKEPDQLELAIRDLPIIGLSSPYLILSGQNGPYHVPTKNKNGFVFLHLERAQQRIYFEKMKDGHISQEMQELLLPMTMDLTPAQAMLIDQTALESYGIGLRPFGNDSYVIERLHPAIAAEKAVQLVETLLESSEQAVVASQSMHKSVMYSYDEAKKIAFELLKCRDITMTPNGQPIYFHMDEDDVEQLFKTTGKFTPSNTE